jgi:hypothetical protein
LKVGLSLSLGPMNLIVHNGGNLIKITKSHGQNGLDFHPNP